MTPSEERPSTSVIMSEASSLIGALRNLNEKNLSNLIPHPLYSRFYYSHPTLAEREAALTDASCALR
jgi:STE24 endopeptidase